MQITTQVKLLPTCEQIILLKSTMQEYINTTNNVVNDYVVGDNSMKHTSKSVIANLPSDKMTTGNVVCKHTKNTTGLDEILQVA